MTGCDFVHTRVIARSDVDVSDVAVYVTSAQRGALGLRVPRETRANTWCERCGLALE